MNQFQTFHPGSGELLATWNYHTSDQIEKMLSRLSRARSCVLSVQERAIRLLSLKGNLLNKKEELARSICVEMGKPICEARQEVEKSVSAVDFVLENLTLATVGRSGVLGQKTRFHIQPVGLSVIFGIMPWNFPIWQTMRCLPLAFAQGSAFLLKHSDLVAGTAQIFSEIVIGALGEEFFGSLRLTHDQAAKVIADPRVRLVTMTGSSKGGAEVATHAARALKKVILELGGSDPFLVFPDADLECAVQTAVESRLLNNGQSCISAKRFLIHKKVFDEFIDKFAKKMAERQFSDPETEDCRLGPLAHIRFAKRTEELCQRLQSEGGQLIWKSRQEIPGGSFFQPQMWKVQGTEAIVVKEEFFAPVALLMSFSSESEAVTLANCTQYGLGATVFSEDECLFRRIAGGLDCGMIAWNELMRSDVRIPFGGVKFSGFGRELGLESFGELVGQKTIFGRLSVK